MDLLADLSRRLESLIRLGTVAAVDHAAARCVVQSGKLTTKPLPWLTLRAGDTRTWNPPTVGEQVLLLCPSGEPASGIVLAGLYAIGKPSPSASAAEHVTTYPDGARIAYDHAAGALEATGIKTARLQASESVTLDSPETHVTGNVTIDGNLHVKGTALIEMLLTWLSGVSGYPGTGDAAAGALIRGPIVQEGGDFRSEGKVWSGDVSARCATICRRKPGPNG